MKIARKSDFNLKILPVDISLKYLKNNSKIGGFREKFSALMTKSETLTRWYPMIVSRDGTGISVFGYLPSDFRTFFFRILDFFFDDKVFKFERLRLFQLQKRANHHGVDFPRACGPLLGDDGQRCLLSGRAHRQAVRSPTRSGIQTSQSSIRKNSMPYIERRTCLLFSFFRIDPLFFAVRVLTSL